MEILGIDIGSYGIKGCIVDTEKGAILSKRFSTPPLEETAPHKVLSSMHDIVNKHFKWDGPVGCAFPAPVNNGVVLSTRRIETAWVDTDAEQLFSEITGNPVTVINDTDAAGIAEMRFGAGKNHPDGTVIMLSVGTGIGSSLFRNGQLIPNTEFGLIEIKGISIEQRASNKTRKEEGIGRRTWGKRLQQVLETLEYIFHPDLFVLGGQLSRKADKTFPYIRINTSFLPAEFQNDASIVGAAMLASDAYPPFNRASAP